MHIWMTQGRFLFPETKLPTTLYVDDTVFTAFVRACKVLADIVAKFGV